MQFTHNTWFVVLFFSAWYLYLKTSILSENLFGFLILSPYLLEPAPIALSLKKSSHVHSTLELPVQNQGRPEGEDCVTCQLTSNSISNILIPSHWVVNCLPVSKQMLDTTLPLRMDRMHVKEQSETSNISCPQELHVDEEDWTVACPNLYPQS